MRKNIFILCTVLFFLIVLYGIIKIIQQIKKPARPRIEINPEKVTNFTISSEKGIYRFKKEFDEWKIEEFKCDKKLIEQFFEKIKNLRLIDIISENKERWQEFEVTETSGIKVEFLNVSFILGKMAYDWSHYYFRFTNKNEIWLSKGLERYFLDKSLNDWRDKTILSINSDEISEIEISSLKNKKKGLEKMLLSKTSDYWLMNKKEKIEQEKINTLLNTLSSFYADDFSDEKQLKNIELVVKIKTIDGKNYEINAGDKKENKYLVKTNITDTLFVVYEYKIENFNLLQKQKQ